MRVAALSISKYDECKGNFLIDAGHLVPATVTPMVCTYTSMPVAGESLQAYEALAEGSVPRLRGRARRPFNRLVAGVAVVSFIEEY
jgi:hypothetical protein